MVNMPSPDHEARSIVIGRWPIYINCGNLHWAVEEYGGLVNNDSRETDLVSMPMFPTTIATK